MKKMSSNEILMKARKRLGWTQVELGKYFKVDQSYISDWELNKSLVPDDILMTAKEVMLMKKSEIQVRFSRPINSRKNEINVSLIRDTSQTPNLPYFPHKNSPKKGGSVPFNNGFSTGENSKCGNKLPEEGSDEFCLLDFLLGFRKKHKRYPYVEDFRKGEVKTFTLAEFEEAFGSIRKAKALATELRKQKREEKRKERRPKGAFDCSICGNWALGVFEHYDNMRQWLSGILDTVRGENYQETVMKIRDDILFPTNCFCGKKPKDDYRSPLRIIIGGRLENLLQCADGRSPQDAAEDSRRAIFGLKEEKREMKNERAISRDGQKIDETASLAR